VTVLGAASTGDSDVVVVAVVVVVEGVVVTGAVVPAVATVAPPSWQPHCRNATPADCRFRNEGVPILPQIQRLRLRRM